MKWVMDLPIEIQNEILRDAIKIATEFCGDDIYLYELMDNVMIPQKSASVSNGIESSSTVFDYKLNADIPDSEFLPPIFTENKIRNRMDRFYNNRKENRGFKNKLSRPHFDDKKK